MESILDIIYVPLAWIFKLCYMLVDNYGIAILLFALIAKLLMLPLGIKGEKGRLKMAAIQPKLNQLQAKYKGDTKNPKYTEEMQQLYQQEGYNPMSGCLPSLIQLPIILGLWNAVRQPLTYIVGLNKLTRYAIVDTLYNLGIDKIVDGLGKIDIADTTKVLNWLKTNEVRVAQVLNDDSVLASVKASLEAYKASGKDVTTEITQLNLDFLGLDLGMAPSDYGILAWTTIIPIVAGITGFLVSFIQQKIAAQPSANGQNNSMNMLLYTMPLISVWLGYSFQNAIGIYWIFSNILSIGQIFLLKAIVKPPKPAEKPEKEKKLNYNQIEKMKREGNDPFEVIEVPEEEQKKEDK